MHDACGENQFRCDNKQCINEASVCDFKIDCIDGSDESTETCGKMTDEWQNELKQFPTTLTPGCLYKQRHEKFVVTVTFNLCSPCGL